MFRPNLDKFRGIFGITEPNNNKSLHKTDYFNMLSDY